MSDLTPVEWLQQTVRIERHEVFFGDTKVPGCIAEGGVTFKPGGGTDMNRLIIEFLVGPLVADDPTVEEKVFDHAGLKVRDGR